jgi:hypothetical protein
MIDSSVKLNEVQAEKICKQTEDLYPYHPLVYKLKDRLLSSNENYDLSKIENLLNGMIIYPYLYIFHLKKIVVSLISS